MEKLKKRDRAVNFSQEETDELLKQVELKKNIIENKKSDSVIWQKKENAWKAIECAFNSAIGSPFRDSKHLKNKYDAIKRDTRKKIACFRAERYKTGVGINNTPPLTPTKVKVKQMILLSVEGSESVYDSNNNRKRNKNEEAANQDDVLIEIAGSSNSINDMMIQIPGISNEHVQKKIKRVENVAKDWQEWIPNLLKSKKHPALCNEKKKTNFEELTEVKLEIAFLQKRLVEEELEIKAIQKKILQNDLEQKRQMFELEMEHKKEIYKLEIENLLLKNQNLKN